MSAQGDNPPSVFPVRRRCGWWEWGCTSVSESRRRLQCLCECDLLTIIGDHPIFLYTRIIVSARCTYEEGGWAADNLATGTRIEARGASDSPLLRGQRPPGPHAPPSSATSNHRLYQLLTPSALRKAKSVQNCSGESARGPVAQAHWLTGSMSSTKDQM